jgi:hypothetical protein
LPTHGPDLSRFNLTQLRALSGLAERTIRKRLGDLQPVARDGRTVWYPARDALERIYLTEALNPQLEKARLDRAKREQLEDRLARERGNVIAADAPERMLVQLAKLTRDRILAVPSGAYPEIAARTSPELARSIGFIVDRHLRAALSDLADQGDAHLARKGAKVRELGPG